MVQNSNYGEESGKIMGFFFLMLYRHFKSVLKIFVQLKSCFKYLPVSTAIGKKSFSTLRFVKSYRRNTMNQKTLNGLFKMHIYRGSLADEQTVVELTYLYKKVPKNFNPMV